MDEKDLHNEIDMLKGNINRIMVSDDIEEISLMYYWATKRLATIFKGNLDRVSEKSRFDLDFQDFEPQSDNQTELKKRSYKMTFTQAVETIGRLQEDVTDKVLLGEEPYPPDEYFVAVNKVLPYLNCLRCMALQSTNNNGREFVPHCNAQSFVSYELNADELPFG